VWFEINDNAQDSTITSIVTGNSVNPEHLKMMSIMAQIFIVAFEPKPIAIPLKDFYTVPLTIAKNEQSSVKWIEVETSFYNLGQAIDLLPHISSAAG
jgi:hypothetical protein